MQKYRKNITDDKELINMYLDLIFTIVSLVAVLITLDISIKRINLYKSGNLNNYTREKLGKESELAVLFLIITALFFTYRTYQDYKKDPSSANRNFLIATILALIAAIIRYITLYKNRGGDFEGVEDVI